MGSVLGTNSSQTVASLVVGEGAAELSLPGLLTLEKQGPHSACVPLPREWHPCFRARMIFLESFKQTSMALDWQEVLSGIYLELFVL